MQRFPTNKPTVTVGSTVMSGTPNTGQILQTYGGTHTHTNFSGAAGGDTNIWVGAGRLDLAFFVDSAMIALSGKAVTFYDAAAAVSGGPLATSGHKVVGVLAPSDEMSATGISGAALRGGQIRQFGVPFWSGLCVTGTSGAAGFTACYTPVLSGATINP